MPIKPNLTAQFTGDVASHVMQVLRDDGVYRHLRFQTPGTSNMGFDLITWPGHLCYCGDMGSFVFERLPDMFQFFRGHGPNFRYWAGKLQAFDRCDGFEEFSAEVFRSKATEYVNDPDWRVTAAQRVDILEDIEHFDGSEQDAYQLLTDWVVEDNWEWRLREYTLRFQWCCHAIPWAIALYDASSMAPATEARP